MKNTLVPGVPLAIDLSQQWPRLRSGLRPGAAATMAARH